MTRPRWTLGELPRFAEPSVWSPPTAITRSVDTGLRVLAVGRSSVPLVEVRLRLDWAGCTWNELPALMVLSRMLFTRRTRLPMGCRISASSNADRLVVSASGPASELVGIVKALALALSDPDYPAEQVALVRERLAHRCDVGATNADQLAINLMVNRLHQGHPHPLLAPTAEAVLAVDPLRLVELHSKWITRSSGSLVVVGDISPEKTLDSVEGALATGLTREPIAEWRLAPMHGDQRLLVADVPGAVQSRIRYGFAATARRESDYSALKLANLIFGGYFSARLTERLREQKGYAYSAYSSIGHAAAGATIQISTDTAAEVTVPALREIERELDAMRRLCPVGDELDRARQYAIGSLALSVSTQVGLADMLCGLAGCGLDDRWLAEHAAQLAHTPEDSVRAAAERYFGPSAMTRVVVGDLDTGAVIAGASELGLTGEVVQFHR